MTEKANELCSQSSGQFKEIDAFIDELASAGSLDGKLIAVLHRAQEIVGYLPSEVQAHVARRLNIPSAKVYGVVTFYSFFSTVPKGKYVINCCLGTACFVRGAEPVLNKFKQLLSIEPGETTEEKLFSLNALRCVGACGLAPVVMVNEKVYGKVTPDDVEKIIEEYKAEGGSANE